MTTKGTPSYRYKYRTSIKDLKKSYEVRLAAQFGGPRAKQRLAAYNRSIKERRMAEGDIQYRVDGRIFSIYQMMEYIVSQVSSGESLPIVCDTTGMPSMHTVYSWFDNHPEFERDYYRAEEIRGHRMGEEALEIAKGSDRVNVNAQKLQVETLSKFAARANRRFQDKQVIEKPDELAGASVEQLRSRIARMLEASPELASTVLAHLHGVGPSGLETEAQLVQPDQPSLGSNLTDTLDEAEDLPTEEDPHLED